jgi:hypothetical protein
MEFIYGIISVFSLTAILGLYLLSLVLRNKTTPKAVSVLHGLFAFTALILLSVYVLGQSPGPVESLIVFCVAAMGGIVLIYRDITGKTIPKALAIGHGLLAITGFILLLVYAFA